MLRTSSSVVIKSRPLVLCGPSGSGKSTLLKLLMSEFKNEFGFSISHTTRSPRHGEVNGREYHFVTRETMEEAINKGDFIEHATFSGNSYGTSKASVTSVEASGRICILDIDVQGVKQLKAIPEISPRLVFVKPPSIEELKRRLEARGTENQDSLAKRLQAAQQELTYGLEPGNFEIIIENGAVVEEAYSKLRDYILPAIESLRNSRKDGGGDK